MRRPSRQLCFMFVTSLEGSTPMSTAPARSRRSAGRVAGSVLASPRLLDPCVSFEARLLEALRPIESTMNSPAHCVEGRAFRVRARSRARGRQKFREQM